MQMSGVVSIVKEVLAEDTTTHDLYKSIEVKVKDLRFSMPKPLFLKEGEKEFGIVLQYTSSGTIDLKLIPVTKAATSKEELEAAAENKVRADRNRATAPTSPDAVDKDSPEFKKALAEVKKEAKAAGGKNSLARATSPIKAEFKSGKDGKSELVSGKNS